MRPGVFKNIICKFMKLHSPWMHAAYCRHRLASNTFLIASIPLYLLLDSNRNFITLNQCPKQLGLFTCTWANSGWAFRIFKLIGDDLYCVKSLFWPNFVCVFLYVVIFFRNFLWKKSNVLIFFKIIIDAFTIFPL